MRRPGTLLAAREGSATVEFAFVSLFLFGIVMVALDFGVYAQQRLKLGSAVEQGAILAYNRQVGGDTSMIVNYVKAAAGTSATPAVTISCNGTSSCGDGRCSCLTATGGFTTPSTSCNTACAGSSAISGNYLKIVATTTYRAVVVPDRYLGGKALTQSAVVRLQ